MNTDMSVEALEQLKRDWYEDARKSSKFAKLCAIARVLGVNIRHNYGPKWEFVDGDIRIYVDDYGNYMTVTDGKRLVCSTHNERIYIPDVCDEIIAKGYPVVEEIQADMMASWEEMQKETALHKELFG